MGETAANQRISALHADDAALEGALADLDARLTAWLMAMRGGQTALFEGVSRVSSAARVPLGTGRVAPPGNGHEPRSTTGRGSRLCVGDLPAASGPRRGCPPAEAPATGDREPPTSSDDEALLASLDAETARVVRVRRRLANNGRGVRELLDEMRSKDASGSEARSARTRWWRRGNERTDG